MTDEAADPYQAFEARIAKLLETLPRIDPPPPEVVRAAQAVRPYADTVRAALQLADMTSVKEVGGQLVWVVSEAKTYQVPVPTAADLAGADQTLRTQLLDTTDQELQDAVSKIPSDPEKVNQVAFLYGLIEKTTGVKGSGPWVVLVLVYWLCTTMNPTTVTSLGTALAVVALLQGTKPGG